MSDAGAKFQRKHVSQLSRYSTSYKVNLQREDDYGKGVNVQNNVDNLLNLAKGAGSLRQVGTSDFYTLKIDDR